MFSNHPIPNILSKLHFQLPLYTHPDSCHMPSGGFPSPRSGEQLHVQLVKQNQLWQPTGAIHNNCPGSLIKRLPLTADRPAPADLPSMDHYSNGDLYVGMLLTNHWCPGSAVPPGPLTKLNTTHTLLSPTTKPPAPRLHLCSDGTHQKALG